MDNTESISAKLRRWANESEKKQRYVYPTFCAYDDMDIEITESDYISERALFRRIADDIDAEHQSILRNCAYPLTQEVSKPTKEDEDFKSWLDRWYIQRPLFEDGEPVQFGEMADHPILGKPSPIKSIEYFGDGSFALWFDGTEAITGYDNGERVKRPKPQVLDADGVPIEVGDVGWLTHMAYPTKVRVEYIESDAAVRFLRLDEDHDWDENFLTSAEHFTHSEPDTQERIDADALKTSCNYFGVSGKPCDECPIHGSEIGCSNEKSLDLLRRQRELDNREGK